MIDKIYKLLYKYREIVKYGIFGVLTTLVNYICYIILTRGFSMHELWGTGIAFILSIIFAYFTNRKWVFESQTVGKEKIAEFFKFVIARISGLFLDLGIMWLFVTHLGYNDLIIKILSNIFIILLNFVISKVFVFKKKAE
ncbi:MAG: GtrA family protein [Bacillota bacterium]